MCIEDLESKKGLQFIHLNTRSLMPKLPAIKNDLINSHVGVLGISETWLSGHVPDKLVNIPGYQIIRNDRTYGRGGGTCLYVRDNLTFEVTMKAMSLKEVEIQSVTLTGERLTGQSMKQIEVIIICRPPKGKDNEALRIILEFIGTVGNAEKKDLLIMGDLNWDYLEKRGIGKRMIDEIRIGSCLTYINIPTRSCMNRESLLDLMLSNMRNISEAGCLDYALSDHFPVFVIKRR